MLPGQSVAKVLADEKDPVALAIEYNGTHSKQTLAGDLNLSGAPTGGYLAGVMGNVLGDDLENAGGGIVAGVVGSYNITAANDSTNPKGGVVGEIGDLAADADGAVVAVLGGDSGQLKPNAAFKAMSMNSTAGSGFDYGLDLNAPAHDGYGALAINKAILRSPNETCILEKAGVPTDGVDGAGFAGPGSMCIDITNKNAYINANTKASPTWKLMTRAA